MLQQQALFGVLNSPTSGLGPAHLQEDLTEILSPLFQNGAPQAVNSQEDINQNTERQQQHLSSPTTLDVSMKWQDASVKLGVEEDKLYLSGLQCLLRSEFIEAFGCKQVRVYGLF